MDKKTDVIDNEDYKFLQEQIKDRPINRRKLIKRSITTVLMAIIFGLVACITFILLEPVFSKMIEPKPAEEEPPVVVISEEDELLPEDMLSEKTIEEPAGPISTSSSPADSLNEYQSAMNEMKSISEDVQKSLVTITSIVDNEDFFAGTARSDRRISGLLVADNTTDYIIIAKMKESHIGDSVAVTFASGETVKATIYNKDNNTGYVAITVPLNGVPLSTKGEISYAHIGNSNVTGNVGDIVMALGNPLGYDNSVSYGMITSRGIDVSLMDCNYKLMTTDIYGSTNASGVIVNTKGQVIGLIDQSFNPSDMTNHLSAIGITEFKSVIEMLSNGVTRPHLGLYVENVRKEDKILYHLPDGAFVTDMEIDSPAFLAGFRKGDIIFAVNDAIVGDVSEFETEMKYYASGDSVVISVLRSNGASYTDVNLTVNLE